VILAGDVGGTKTHLACFAPGGSPRHPEREQRYASHEHASLESLARAFLEETGAPPPTRAVFGIAGVVIRNRCETTNLPWHVDGEELSHALGGASVTLLNDLAATAHGLEVLEREDLEAIQRGDLERGTRAVLAAGTGLGMVSVAREHAGLVIAPSEGGHADFAPRTAIERELAAWLGDRHGRASVERVLSGRGLADLYRFLSATGRGQESPGFADRFMAADDPAALVSEAALERSCERAELALGMFVDVYAAEAGNLALRTLPNEGLYLGGGIAPRVRSAILSPRFLEVFRDKAPMADLMRRFPVHLILDSRAALWGAAHLALHTRVHAS
jgi:glucokinase